jgi:hypothetical protein
MATIREIKSSKIDPKYKKELLNNLQEIIQRVENDEIELFAATTLDNNGDIAAYTGRLRKANMLEILGLIEMFSDYLKGQAHEEGYYD